MTNTGDAALEFTAALHTYLAVSSVGQVELRGGFEGCEYLDKLDGLTKRARSLTLSLTLSLSLSLSQSLSLSRTRTRTRTLTSSTG